MLHTFFPTNFFFLETHQSDKEGEFSNLIEVLVLQAGLSEPNTTFDTCWKTNRNEKHQLPTTLNTQEHFSAHSVPQDFLNTSHVTLQAGAAYDPPPYHGGYWRASGRSGRGPTTAPRVEISRRGHSSAGF